MKSKKIVDLTIYKDLLLLFMYCKNKIIKKETGLTIFDKPDFDEARLWSERVCWNILDNLSVIGDDACCPWCIKFNNDCSRCSYGKRHLKCDKNNKSRYSIIIDRLRKHEEEFVEYPDPNIHDLDGIQDLISSIDEMFSNVPEEYVEETEKYVS